MKIYIKGNDRETAGIILIGGWMLVLLVGVFSMVIVAGIDKDILTPTAFTLCWVMMGIPIIILYNLFNYLWRKDVIQDEYYKPKKRNWKAHMDKRADRE